MILPVILSGGSGTRLWPMSRKLHPKQLLPLLNDTSMLHDTVKRCLTGGDVDRSIVICNEEYRFMVAEQVRATGVKHVDIILEPEGRNTAPAIALAALMIVGEGRDDTMLVLPADHDIRNVEAFQQAIRTGESLAEAGRLVTFGIIPDKPETGYGYIKAGEAIEAGGAEIARFVEKPDLETARSYIEEGGYFWNSGMFMFKASSYVDALRKHAPAIVTTCEKALSGAARDMDFIRLDVNAFKACPSDSIDYAVMEQVDNGAVIPVDIGWSDVGSWSALHELGERDADGNVTIGDVISVETKDSYIRSESRLVATLGLKGLTIVDTEDALLIASNDRLQEIKQIVETLQGHGRDEAMLPKRVCRPWGCYQGVDESEGFQVKRITVKPRGILSLQLHHQRAEHWIVVNGKARVTRGDEEFELEANESTYIPLGVKHRLENIGDTELELIEVQTGGYLGEDDIVRFDDIYGRNHDG